jgi:complex iron-sulfur molybdoenzyme family reductase subunit gamma
MFASFSDRPRLLAVLVVGAILALGLGLQLLNANPAASQTAQLIAWEVNEDPGLDPDSEAWQVARSLSLPMSGQLGLYAAGGGSITSVTASAVHYHDTLYVRLEWRDSTQDEVTTRVEDFSDAAALEFPAQSASTVPSICMGQADAGVNIWHWRADSQQSALDPNLVYTNSLVDAYPPQDDDLWYPARAVGNPIADISNGPVQTLIAQAFGTLSPATEQGARGEGQYADGKWTVVFSRPFRADDPSQAEFSAGGTTDMAVALWNGSEGDRNGQKSTSAFVTLRLGGALAGDGDGDNTAIFALAIFTFVGVAALGLALAAIGYRQSRRLT